MRAGRGGCPRRIRSVGSAVPVWLIVNTPPRTSARPTVPGPSGVVVIASIATVPPAALIVVPTGTSPAPRSWASSAPVAGACDVAGATSTRASTGVIVTVRPTSGPATGVGSGAQFGSVPLPTVGVKPGSRPSAGMTETCGPDG